MQANDAEVAAALQSELVRLQRASSHEALGLMQNASKSQIRAAFLRDTKRFHPNRFARRGREVTRLANEVFLLIKNAYYDLANANPGPPTERTQSAPAPMQSPVAVTQQATVHRRTVGYRTGPVRAIADSGSGKVNQVSARGTGPRQSISGPSASGRESATGQGGRYAIVGGQRRSATSSPAIRPPPVDQSVPPTGGADVAEGLVRVLQLAEQKKWHEAMAVLQRLFQSHPRDRRIQAYAHFIRGREYESVGDVENARVEYERVLGIDPTVEAAQRALVKLRARARPSRR